ncbi:VanW family protein [Cytobacillus solani]|uniref:G5 domain-containing protein n=1 Tax=Cytobacillus solani TaxID=1637975 RepID=UPI00207AC646|nr:G5 domain-containing protein [Cytobacillus solani]USK53924.1 VanW family protein [Cytobacillus solani]
MGNKQTVRLFLVMIFSTTYIFSFSHFGVSAYDAIMNKSNSFDNGTFIGTVDVSGKTKSEAMRMVDEQLTKWLNGTTIFVHFKEKMIEFNVHDISFDIEKTVNNAQQGKKNKLMVTTDEVGVLLEELSPTITADEYNIEKINSEILNIASSLQIEQFNFKIEDFLLDTASQNKQVINQVTLDLNTIDFDEKFMEQLKDFDIEPSSQFSLLSQMDELGLGDVSIETMNILASSIYELILPTNFLVIERHISENLPAYAKLGYEAKVNPEMDMDFIFMNENDGSYKVSIEKTDSNLVISLIGPSFLNQYKIIEKDEKIFKPKTIVQFNPQLSPIEKSVKTEGKEGRFVRIYRETYDEKGERLKEEKLSEDFYPPVHQVEVRGLIKDESTSSTDNNDTAGELENQTSQSMNNADLNQTNNEEESANYETPEINSNDDNNLWGKPNETFK